MAKINHFIVLLLENRSFDHIFGFATPPDGESIENLRNLNPPPSNLLNPSQAESDANPAFSVSQPAPFAVHHPEGPSHSFNSVNLQIFGDKNGPSDSAPASNNGFARSYANVLSGRSRQVDKEHIAEVMECFSPDQLPSINQLAREFCLCDHWHCEVPGPTMANRMFMHAATSEGYVHNDFHRPYSSKTVYELFEEKGLTWAIYFHDLFDLLQFPKLTKTPEHIRRFETYAEDVAVGDLPTFTFLFPRFMNARSKNGETLQANSQHAPEDVRFADHLIADVYEPLAAHPELFRQTALVVTYDEHGGFYDHVLPGEAPNPDGQNSPNPDDAAKFAPPFAFDRIGLRVPAIIVSPWIAKGSVEHRALQHTSVIRTVTEMFGLSGPLNRRDESAQSFADLFDKLSQPRAPEDMPKSLERAPLDAIEESVLAGTAIDPADEPLDDLTGEWSLGMLSLLSGGLEGFTAAPSTQGEAASAIDAQLRAAGL